MTKIQKIFYWVRLVAEDCKKCENFLRKKIFLRDCLAFKKVVFLQLINENNQKVIIFAF